MGKFEGGVVLLHFDWFDQIANRAVYDFFANWGTMKICYSFVIFDNLKHNG